MIYFIVGIGIALAFLLWRCQNQMDDLVKKSNDLIVSSRETHKETIFTFIDTMYEMDRENNKQTMHMAEYLDEMAKKLICASELSDPEAVKEKIMIISTLVNDFSESVKEAVEQFSMKDEDVQRMKDEISTIYAKNK